MHIEIRSRFGPLAAGIAGRLGSEHGWEVEVSATAVESCELRYSPDINPVLLSGLLAAVRPIEVVCSRVPELGREQIELDLTDRSALSTWNIVVHGEAEFAAGVAEQIRALGFTRVSVKKGKYVPSDRMLYGGASAFARQVVAWELRRHGCHLEEVKQWHDGDHDIFLYVVSPAHRGLPPRQMMPVSLVTDLGDKAEAMIQAIRQAGFGTVCPEIADTLAGMSHLGLDPGQLEACEDEVGIGLLLGIAQRFADEARVDPIGFPVRRLPANEDQPKLYLPINAIRRGVLAPYAGPYPARFKLRLRTDDRAAGLALTREFAKQGFREATKRAIHDLSQGFAIFYGPAAGEPCVVEIVRKTLEREMVQRGIVAHPISFLPGSDEDVIEVIAPFRACQDGTLVRELANPKRFSLTITGPEPLANEIAEYAGELGFTAVRVEGSDGSNESAGWVEFGGAPLELIYKLRDGIAERYGEAAFLRTRKSWPVTDMRIVINMPRLPTTLRAARQKLWRAISGVRPASTQNASPFIEVSPSTVRIGRVELARPGQVHPLVPDIEALQPFCIDPKTAAILEFLADSVKLGEPSLLIGPTSSSKTSAAQFLASLIGQPLARINLHGHSDSGELVGRVIPEQLGWAWHDGFVPRGMRKGIWLLIDEVNLAEAQVAERLNSALERPPTLVISEHINELINKAHPRFWICATANPAGQYNGRSPMSPAFRDRFIATSLVPAPGEEDYLAYLRLCVFGIQPAIEVYGVRYGGGNVRPIYPRLAHVRGFEEILIALARFHTSVAAAMAPGTNSSSGLMLEGEGAPTFTRRGLAACLRFIDIYGGNASKRELADVIARALNRYYLQRVAPEQADPIRDLAHAAGLGSA